MSGLATTLLRKGGNRLLQSAKNKRQERKAQRHEHKTAVAKANALANKASQVQEKLTHRDHKHELKLAKMVSQQKKKDAKALAKSQAKDRKHELELAQSKVDLIKAGKILNPARIARYITVIKVLAPLLAPLIYRGTTLLREYLESQGKTDVSLNSLVGKRFSKLGSKFNVRINKANASLDKISAGKPGDLQVKQFVTTTKKELENLATAVDNAESFPTARKFKIHRDIDKHLAKIEETILHELGTFN